jgi:hypothetical protein
MVSHHFVGQIERLGGVAFGWVPVVKAHEGFNSDDGMRTIRYEAGAVFGRLKSGVKSLVKGEALLGIHRGGRVAPPLVFNACHGKQRFALRAQVALGVPQQSSGLKLVERLIGPIEAISEAESVERGSFAAFVSHRLVDG